MIPKFPSIEVGEKLKVIKRIEGFALPGDIITVTKVLKNTLYLKKGKQTLLMHVPGGTIIPYFEGTKMANLKEIEKFCKQHNIVYSEELHAQRFVFKKGLKRMVWGLSKFEKFSTEEAKKKIKEELC